MNPIWGRECSSSGNKWLWPAAGSQPQSMIWTNPWVVLLDIYKGTEACLRFSGQQGFLPLTVTQQFPTPCCFCLPALVGPIVFQLMDTFDFSHIPRMRSTGRGGIRTTSPPNAHETPAGWRRTRSRSEQLSWSVRTQLWGQRSLSYGRSVAGTRMSSVAMKLNLDQFESSGRLFRQNQTHCSAAWHGAG